MTVPLSATLLSHAPSALESTLWKATASATPVASATETGFSLGGWDEIRTLIGAILILLGAVLTFVAAVGVALRRDPYERMHASSKPQLLGLLLLCTGIVVETGSLKWLAMGTAIVLLQAVTVPVGSHLVARAFDRTHRLDEPADEDC